MDRQAGWYLSEISRIHRPQSVGCTSWCWRCEYDTLCSRDWRGGATWCVVVWKGVNLNGSRARVLPENAQRCAAAVSCIVKRVANSFGLLAQSGSLPGACFYLEGTTGKVNLWDRASTRRGDRCARVRYRYKSYPFRKVGQPSVRMVLYMSVASSSSLLLTQFKACSLMRVRGPSPFVLTRLPEQASV